MPGIARSIDEFNARVTTEKHRVHTVELATPDTQGHLRGKRIPLSRYLERNHQSGANIAEFIFAFDVQNDLPANEFINLDSGYMDCHLVPDNSTGRILTHRPGYALVFADAINEHREPHPLSPRAVLAAQVEWCRAAGLEPIVATEMEFYLCQPDWTPVQQHIQFGSVTDAIELESVLYAMREALVGAGIDVESSYAEYGPGQVEINTAPVDAMTAADNAALFKSIVKQVAVQHGLRATFMPKPWTEVLGSGMHVHTSLQVGDLDGFADCADGDPNPLMRNWLGGILEHAEALTLLATPTSNGPKRIRPYTFAPTHVTWGLDNRTVMARCVAESGSPANRVEYRAAGADANPYLLIAGLLAAGVDGIERDLNPGLLCVGDMYTNSGDHPPLPADLPAAIAAFGGSPLAGKLGDNLSRNFVSLARAEVELAAAHSPDPAEVNDWERQRFIEHS